MTDSYQFFAACPKGLELLLVDELRQLDAQSVREARAGCYFSASLSVAYSCVIWSRLASRLVILTDSLEVQDRTSLYEAASRVNWLDHLPVGASFAIAFTGSNQWIRHTQFGAQVLKDAIVDQIRALKNYRAEVNLLNPDVHISAHLKGESLQLGIVLASALSQHGYRSGHGRAPLRESLAAAVLLRAGWQNLTAGDEQAMLVDPVCGSGTLLIEGAMMAADYAPGLLREEHSLGHWLGHKPQIWQQLFSQADERKAAGLAKLKHSFIGADIDAGVLKHAKENANRAGLDQYINFFRCDLTQQHLSNTIFGNSIRQNRTGLIVANPPYGERLGSETQLLFLYRALGETMRRDFPGWTGAVLTASPDLGRRMSIRSHRQYAFYNGALACKLLLFNIPEQQIADKCNIVAEGSSEAQKGHKDVMVPLSRAPSEGAVMFANRLQKNLKHLARWAKKNEIQCYRVYDADLPEYAVAIDLYGDRVRIQEYRAPADINAEKAKDRLNDVVMMLPEVLNVSPAKIVLKQRSRQKGNSQYQREGTSGHRFEVSEGGCRFLVNMNDYVDTGLFLDHRALRMKIQQEAIGCRFLNLFCYTATATVHAAAGGAKASVSVDMSKTYLNWAKENFELNNISLRQHSLVQEDCLQWLKRQTGRTGSASSKLLFDLIYIDPPTFSNSKRMADVFDVQRDHVHLISAAMQLLSPAGKLYFSNNYRKFVLDEKLLNDYVVSDITHKTLDRDFRRRDGEKCSSIHHCWLLKHN